MVEKYYRNTSLVSPCQNLVGGRHVDGLHNKTIDASGEKSFKLLVLRRLRIVCVHNIEPDSGLAHVSLHRRTHSRRIGVAERTNQHTEIQIRSRCGTASLANYKTTRQTKNDQQTTQFLEFHNSTSKIFHYLLLFTLFENLFIIIATLSLVNKELRFSFVF
jgi:hypothetical protein